MGLQWNTSVEDVAVKLGKSPWMVRKHARKGRFGYAAKQIGRLWFFCDELLDDFFIGRKIEARPGRPRKPTPDPLDLFPLRICVPRVRRK